MALSFKLTEFLPLRHKTKETRLKTPLESGRQKTDDGRQRTEDRHGGNIESFDSAQDRYRTRNVEFRREGLRPSTPLRMKAVIRELEN